MLALGLGVIACGDDDSEETNPDAGFVSDAGQTDGGSTTTDGGTTGTDGGTTASACPNSAYCIDGAEVQPAIGVRSRSAITVDGRQFKDSNGNGTLDPYEDWRLSPLARAMDLAPRLTTSQQIGLLHEGGFNVAPTSEDGAVSDDERVGVTTGHIRQTLLRWPANYDGTTIATHFNNLQELAESEPLGIPMIFTSDPIFAAASDMQSTTLTHQNSAPQIRDWPLMLGMAAINDADYVKNVAKMQAEQLRALGMRWLLGPQVDLASEPMWSRVYDTFGAISSRAGAMGTAWIQGFQGKDDGVNPLTGIAATMKHFPGGGANENGMDSHSDWGKFNVFPGNNFEEHLQVMNAVITGSNPAAIMPCYSIFENLTYNGEQIVQQGSSFSKVFMQDILRTQLGWDGMITSDWGAVGACFGPGACIPGSAWGTESWTNAQRMGAFAELGGHQIGLYVDARIMWEDALSAGTVTAEQIQAAAIKVLEVSFKVGAFEDPYVDQTTAAVTAMKYEAESRDAMRRAFTLLKNDQSILPLDGDTADTDGDGTIRVYFNGHDDSAIDAFASQYSNFQVVTSTTQADYAIIRVSARHGVYFGLDGGVPLSFRDPILVYDQATDMPSTKTSTAVSAVAGNSAENNQAGNWIADRLDSITMAKMANPNLKVIVAVSMYRPFVIEPWLSDIDVLAAEFGMTDAALLDMVFQMIDGTKSATLQPTGTLPMEVPSSQQAVYDSREDVPNDSTAPSFAAGAGLTSY